MKSHNKFCQDFSVTKEIPSEEMFRFFDFVETEGQNEVVSEEKIGKKINKSINDRDTECASVEDPVNMLRTT